MDIEKDKIFNIKRARNLMSFTFLAVGSLIIATCKSVPPVVVLPH